MVNVQVLLSIVHTPILLNGSSIHDALYIGYLSPDGAMIRTEMVATCPVRVRDVVLFHTLQIRCTEIVLPDNIIDPVFIICGELSIPSH